MPALEPHPGGVEHISCRPHELDDSPKRPDRSLQRGTARPGPARRNDTSASAADPELAQEDGSHFKPQSCGRRSTPAPAPPARPNQFSLTNPIQPGRVDAFGRAGPTRGRPHCVSAEREDRLLPEASDAIGLDRRMTGSASPELVAHFRAAVIHKPARPEGLGRASRRRLRRGYLIRSNRVSIPGECRPGSRRRPKVGGSRLARVDGDSSSREARLSRSVAFKTTDPTSSRPSCQRHGSTPASPPGGGQPDTVRPPGAHAHQTQSSRAGSFHRHEPGRQGDGSAADASTAGRPHRR